jgi:hypothetical protein
MVKLLIAIVLGVILAACAGNRDVKGDFSSINSGQIPKSNVPAFVDCVTDAFHDRSIGLERMLNRQVRRSTGFRVELVNTGIGLLLSADINDDGHVELFERTINSPWISEEKRGFSLCLERYKAAR